MSNFLGSVQGAIPPPRITRTIETQVNIPDGDTMVIGGIIVDNRTETRNQVPFLGDLRLATSDLLETKHPHRVVVEDILDLRIRKA